jgi:hypothetical protein
VIFSVFVLGALVSLFLTGVYPFAISIGLGLIISVPLVLLGLIRVDRVRRLLDPKEKRADLLAQSEESRNSLGPAPTTDALPTGPIAPGSVTEQTTLNLKHPTRR